MNNAENAQQLALPFPRLLRCSEASAPDDLHHLTWDDYAKRWTCRLTLQFPKLKIVGKRITVRIPSKDPLVAKGVRDGLIQGFKALGLTVAGRKQNRWSQDPKVRAKNRRTHQ
jgi:hypothetical protein